MSDTKTDPIPPTWTVNDTIRRHPETVAVFNAFGVDACCGGAATLEEAAREAGVEPAALLGALEAVVAGRETP